LLFGGSRADEFNQRLNGATYQEIAARGGGIQSTMKATRAAPEAELLRSAEDRLARMLSLGVTTAEAKTGYGLSVKEELRLLEILQKLKGKCRQHLSVTCLALHAKSPDHPDLKSYVDHCVKELLPALAERRLADAVDAFVEAGYFSVQEVEPYCVKAKELGLAVRLHADEFSDAGAAAAAARFGAASADHLQFAADAALPLMAEHRVTAVVLPGTSLYTKIPFTNARRFADAGVPVAVASDFNPGSCLLDNLPFLATIAAVQCGLRPAEAVAAVTYVPATSLGLGRQKGALAPGFDADLQVHEVASLEEWLADAGRTPPRQILIGGS
jgi:imidazolonepropionase